MLIDLEKLGGFQTIASERFAFLSHKRYTRSQHRRSLSHSDEPSNTKDIVIFKTETTLVQFSIDYLKTLTSELKDEDLTQLTDSTGKTPQWILGHLHIASEFGSKMLGADSMCGDDWFAAYGPGSQPGNPDAPEFTIEAVLGNIESGYQRLLELTKAASADELGEKHGFEPLEPAIMTKRDLMSHLLTTHFAFHLAQLSACRRSKGMPPVF